jgi:hypothetical protein
LIHEFVQEYCGGPQVHSVDVQPLAGGLEVPGVSLVRVLHRDGTEAGSFVLKPMSGDAIREYNLHSALQRLDCGSTAPKILGSRYDSAGHLYVFLEWIAAAERWPWSRREPAAMVLNQLARVHRCDLAGLSEHLTGWNYDAELARSAAKTVELYGQMFNSGFRIGQRPMLRPLERVCNAVGAIRAQTIHFSGGLSLLHGDAHPGNVVMRDQNGNREAVLLDWGRARAGSPLEDVMSWLQSLGFWEPHARRIQDCLLRDYRRACGLDDSLTPAYRSACWLAGACNGMAGALRYHLTVAADAQRDPETRRVSSMAAADWLRIVRRADAVWRG